MSLSKILKNIGICVLGGIPLALFLFILNKACEVLTVKGVIALIIGILYCCLIFTFLAVLSYGLGKFILKIFKKIRNK